MNYTIKPHPATHRDSATGKHTLLVPTCDNTTLVETYCNTFQCQTERLSVSSFLICRVHENAEEAGVFDIRRFLRLELDRLAGRLDAVALEDGIRPETDNRARRDRVPEPRLEFIRLNRDRTRLVSFGERRRDLVEIRRHVLRHRIRLDDRLVKRNDDSERTVLPADRRRRRDLEASAIGRLRLGRRTRLGRDDDRRKRLLARRRRIHRLDLDLGLALRRINRRILLGLRDALTRRNDAGDLAAQERRLRNDRITRGKLIIPVRIRQRDKLTRSVLDRISDGLLAVPVVERHPDRVRAVRGGNANTRQPLPSVRRADRPSRSGHRRSDP